MFLERTFVNIYPGGEPVQPGEAARWSATLTEQHGLAPQSARVFNYGADVEKVPRRHGAFRHRR